MKKNIKTFLSFFKNTIKSIIYIFFIKTLDWASKLRPEFKYYEGLNWLIRICKSRTIVEGKKNLPKNSAFIIALNHMGSLNLIFVLGRLFSFLQRPIHVVVQERVWEKNRKLCKQWLAFIPRTQMCVISMIKVLKKGDILGIVPAGIRDRKTKNNKIDKDKMIEEAKLGVGIASNYAPVLPIGFKAPDSNSFWQGVRGLFQILFFKRIKIKIGKLMNFPCNDKLSKEEIQKRSKIVLNEIFCLIDDIHD